MFYSRYPDGWHPDFDSFGNCINEPEPKTPDSTIFLKASLQGDFADDTDDDFKQLTLRLPLPLYADIEAVAKSGTLSRNAVIVSMLSTGSILLGENLNHETIRKLNSLSREILHEAKQAIKQSKDDEDV